MFPKRSATISQDIGKLFADPSVPHDIALQLLNSWIANLQATEERINRTLLAFFGVFVTFLALDTGVLAKITFQGAELQRTGLVMCVAPAAMAYFYYRYMSQIWFVHTLRTAIAMLYKNLREPVYYLGLDLLTHFPSVRTLESYDSWNARSGVSRFHEHTTFMVVVTLALAPLVALVYCINRLWHYPDVGIFLWTSTTALSIVLAVRALLFAWRKDGDEFSAR